MNAILSFGLIFLAFTFCGLGEKLKQASSTGGTNSNAASTNSSSATSPTGEKPQLTSAQQAIMDGASETKWDQQGISWKLPSGWKKMDVKKETFNYQSPDNAFLLVNVSDYGENFPMETSLTATYDQAMQLLKSGKNESVKMVEIDGIPGVEFTEASPEDKDGIRRHQWIGFRRYLGSVQQLNVMTSTRGSNFEKHKDDFAAITYSMKVTK